MTELLDKNAYVKVALGLGAISGIRCMSPLAFLAQAANNSKDGFLSSSFFADDNAFYFIRLLSMAELLIDKLPFLPGRTSIPAVLPRLVTGAVVGATVYGEKEKDRTTGAIVGAVGALGAAVVSHHLRRVLTKNLHLPEFFVATAEDSFVVWSGMILLNILKED